jgi:hypothetical protein
MYVCLLLIFLFFHILADFYLQSETVSLRKDKDTKALLLHCLFYFSVILIPYILFNFDFTVFLISLISGFSHLIIDFFKTLSKKIVSKKENISHKADMLLFFADQFLHIFMIVLIPQFFQNSLSDLEFLPFLDGLSDSVFLRWLIAVAVIGKPTNIIFKKIFGEYKKGGDKSTEKEEGLLSGKGRKSGAIIGFLERLIILICIVNALYTSIGLILTAKSITRYNKISNEPEFAEYYLIGTLSSILFAVASYCIFFILI